MNGLRLHVRALGTALLGFARQPLAAFLSILVIGGALSLPATGYLLLTNLAELAHGLTASPTVTLFLDNSLSPAQVDATGERLRAMDSLQEVRFISRQQALEEMARAGLQDVMEGLKDNPLPDAYVITPKDQSPTTYDTLKQEVTGWPGVENVQADTVWIRRLQALLNFANRIVLLISALLGGSLVVVTFNTIRLQIHTQRHEIEVCRLLGATRPFMQRPFYWSGILQGLLGGGVALGITIGAMHLLNPSVTAVAQNYGTTFALRDPTPEDAALILGSAVLLCFTGTALAIGRHLKTP